MEDLKPIRRCHYRNCSKVVCGNEKKKFCSRSCRSQESVYEMRSRVKLKKEKSIINKIIVDFETLNNQEVLELYKLIFNK